MDVVWVYEAAKELEKVTVSVGSSSSQLQLMASKRQRLFYTKSMASVKMVAVHLQPQMNLNKNKTTRLTFQSLVTNSGLPERMQWHL